MIFPQTGKSQIAETENYEFRLVPDLWYNSLDGVQVGAQFGFRQFGRIDEGPHFFDAGILIGTSDLEPTFNYRANYRHTLLSRAGFERSGINLNSAYRDGFQQHGAGLRWQNKDEAEQNIWSFQSEYYAHEMYDSEYQLYPHLWSEGWTDIIRITAVYQQWADWHRSSAVKIDLRVSPGGLDTSPFARFDFSAQDRVDLFAGLAANIHAYAGWVNEDAPPEYNLGLAGASLIDFQDSRLTRARGTLPPSWFREGFFHKAGGANLRGFMDMEAESRKADLNDINRPADVIPDPTGPTTDAISSLNLELEFPNPVNSWIQSIPVAGEFIKFSSYFFNDTGILSRRGFSSVLLVDAGVGFEVSTNIPDYLGRERGFQIRFDLPFWFYDSNTEQSFTELKPILGFGSIYYF